MSQTAGTPLEKTFRFLVESRRPSAVDVIAYAVLNSSGDARRIAIGAALDAQARAPLEAVIHAFHEIPPDLQTAAIARSDAFLPILRQNVHDADRQVRANTCDFLIRMDDARVAYLLADLLQDAAGDISRKAQEGLLQLAHSYHVFAAEAEKSGGKTPRQVLETKRYSLLDALLTAVRFYKAHERPEMIAALMSLDPRGDEVLLDILANPMDRRRKIILDILERAYHPRAILFLLTMLKNARTASMAVEILETRFDAGFMTALLSAPALLGNARVTAALSQVKFLPWLRPGTEKASQLQPRLAVRAVRMLLYTCAQPAEKRSSLERLAHSKNSALVAAAGFVLAAQVRQIPPDKIDAGLVTIEARCPEPSINIAEPDVSALVAPVPPGRDANIMPDETLFRSFANSFETLGRAERDAMIGDLAAKGVFVRELRKMLADTEPDVALRAVKIIEYRGCQSELSRELALLTRHPDGRVRSAAVKQLGKSAAYEAMKALFDILGDRDRRVLANAVEALEATGHKQVIRLLEPLMKHPDNRVRANAAKAAWSLGSEAGKVVLVEMLKSPKADMRLSALWGLRQIGAREEAPAIREMARSDADEKVRKAAETAAADLENVL